MTQESNKTRSPEIKTHTTQSQPKPSKKSCKLPHNVFLSRNPPRRERSGSRMVPTPNYYQTQAELPPPQGHNFSRVIWPHSLNLLAPVRRPPFDDPRYLPLQGLFEVIAVEYPNRPKRPAAS